MSMFSGEEACLEDGSTLVLGLHCYISSKLNRYHFGDAKPETHSFSVELPRIVETLKGFE
jgi:phage protein U